MNDILYYAAVLLLSYLFLALFVGAWALFRSVFRHLRERWRQ